MGNVNGDDLRGAGFSPRERLERIEALLEKIDEKLDAKADASAVAALELRLRSIEQDGSRPAQEALSEARAAAAATDQIAHRMYWMLGVGAALAYVARLVIDTLS